MIKEEEEPDLQHGEPDEDQPKDDGLLLLLTKTGSSKVSEKSGKAEEILGYQVKNARSLLPNPERGATQEIVVRNFVTQYLLSGSSKILPGFVTHCYYRLNGSVRLSEFVSDKELIQGYFAKPAGSLPLCQTR